MSKLKLTLACGRYDRTQPLIDGRVEPEGVDLTFLPLRPGETFWRMLNHGEFDVSEMSLSSYTILRSEGDTRFIAIPSLSIPRVSAFGSLPAGRFQNRTAARAEGQARRRRRLPDDRGCLGARLPHARIRRSAEDVTWVIGRPVRTIKPPEGIRMEFMPPETTLEAMLDRGEIDALASVMIPKALGTTVRRLFRDPRKVET